MKGRIAPDTPFRRGGQAEWVHAECALEGPVPQRSVPEPWHLTLLDRYATFGIPLGLGLLPWGWVASCIGLLVLAAFAVALIRLLVGISRDLKGPVRG